MAYCLSNAGIKELNMTIDMAYNSRIEARECAISHLSVLPIGKRGKTFYEIDQGFTKDKAMQEASRCLRCKKAPCVTACPLQVYIPEFILAIRERDLPKAARILRRGNPFPGVCGRVCAQESQCESKCTRNRYGKPVPIGALERYVADWMLENTDKIEITNRFASSGKNVAVVGGGPAGLSAAASLVTRGHEVKIYELMNATGGDLLSEIPEFRLPKRVLIGEIARILSLGVRVECNALVGQKISFRQLYTEYDAIFLAQGPGSPVSLGIPGKRLCGIYSARDYLVHANSWMGEGMQLEQLKKFGARWVVIIGGGNTAMDCARVAIRLGAEQVRIVYRHSESEMSARQKEVGQAKEEGVKVFELLSPVEIVGDERGWVKGLVCQAMKPGERDSTGRCKPMQIEGDLRELEADIIIYALGSSSNRINTSIFSQDDHFWREKLVVHKDGSTNFPGIFVGGDKIRKQGTAVQAIADGRRAAVAIDLFLTKGLS